MIHMYKGIFIEQLNEYNKQCKRKTKSKENEGKRERKKEKAHVKKLTKINK